MPVQKSPKDVKQATNTDNESPAKTASTPHHKTKDAQRGDNNKNVE